MNSEKCKGCKWYGKPYWSINNPCDNCPRDNIQVLTRWEDPTIKQLQQENKQLKERIDKALGFLENCNTKDEELVCYIIKLLKEKE